MKRLFLGSTLLLLLGLLTQTAAARTITAAHTGAWYDPGLSGQGFNFEILRPVAPGGPKRFLAFWYTYEDDGSETPTWAVGNTGIVPSEPVIQVVMERPVSSLPAAPMEAVATIEFEFFGCDQARAEVLSGLHAGRVYQLERLTEILAQPCSGGISDDADPYGPVIEIERDLIPTELAPLASGEVEIRIRTGEARFKVEIEDLPINDYALCVDGEFKGTIPVSDDGDGDVEGEIEFESPQDDEHPLLDFDPRDSLIEITDSAIDCAAPVLLFVDLAQAPGNGDDDDNGNDDDGDDEGPPSGERQEWEAELVNLGVFPDAEGDADFRLRADRSDFSVEIEDVPVGEYELWVGGIERGTIEVRALGNARTEGEIEFRDPPQAGKLPLDFDPRGLLIEVLLDDGVTVILEGELQPEDD